MHERSEAEALAREAHTHFEAGRWRDALKALDRALALDPDQSDWHFNRGLVLDALARYEEAVDSFETALALRGDEPDTELQLAISMLRSGRAAQRAVTLLQQLIARDRDEPAPYAYLIAGFAQLGDHEEAEQTFYLAQQLFEESALCYEHMGHSLAMRAEWPRAAWCWERALELEPDHPNAAGELARARWALGDLEKADRCFLRQRSRDGDDGETSLAHGGLLLEMGRLGEARECLERATSAMPDHPEAHLGLGEVWLRSGQFEPAEDHLMRALQLGPQTAGLNLRLGQLERQRGVTEKARAFAFAELCVPGRTVAQTLELAELLVNLEMAGRAVVPLTRLLAEEPLVPEDRGRALWLRASACLLSGETARGVADGRRAWHLTPVLRRQIAPLVTLGLIKLRAWPRARVWLRRCARLDGVRPGMLRLRARYGRARLAHALWPWSRSGRKRAG